MGSLVGPDEDREDGKIPVPDEIQEAIRTLLRWTGDDPSREGLLDTPKRVARDQVLEALTHVPAKGSGAALSLHPVHRSRQ